MVERQRLAVEAETVGVDDAVVHHHRDIEAQLTDLRVGHLLVDRVDRDVAVDGDSSAGEGVAVAIDGHGHADLQSVHAVPCREGVAVQLALDGRLDVRGKENTLRRCRIRD